MDNTLDLYNTLVKYTHGYKKRNYKLAYYWIRSKRYLIHTLMIFLVQYMNVSCLPFSNPALPMYPPIGIAFAMFYLFGNNSWLALILGGFCAYITKGIGLETTLLYLSADLGAGFIGAKLCQNVFTSDLYLLRDYNGIQKFCEINAFITCVISSSLRVYANLATHQISIYEFIDFWLADLNAIFIIASLLLSWTYIPFSRERISNKKIKLLYLVLVPLYIISAVLFMKQLGAIYLIIFGMLASLHLAFVYGNLIATALLFINACIYVAFFVMHQQQYLQILGTHIYTMVPIMLLLYTIGILYLGNNAKN